MLLIVSGLAARRARREPVVRRWRRGRARARHVARLRADRRRQRLLHPRSSTRSASSSSRRSSTCRCCSSAFGVRATSDPAVAVVADARDPLRVLQAAASVPLPWGVLTRFAGSEAGHGARLRAGVRAGLRPVQTSLVMLAASLFGLFVGAVPGLTATMATALLVPVTFFMAPIPAIAAIVTATAMAIFSGDIPGCLLRMPGTPASAAYTDEAYAMTRKGQAETGARRGPRVLGDRRPVRHGGADRGGARARRVRAQVQLVRVFLARAARADLRGLHHRRAPAQGLRVAAARPADRLRRASATRRASRASRSATSS